MKFECILNSLIYMATKRLKRTDSKSFVRSGLKSNDDEFVNIGITSQTDRIFDLQRVETVINKFVNDISEVAPIDRNRLHDDIFKIFQRNTLIPPLIETPCRICSRFISTQNENQLCGITRCLNCNYLLDNNHVAYIPIKSPDENVPNI